jgi:hypothetical protein
MCLRNWSLECMPCVLIVCVITCVRERGRESVCPCVWVRAQLTNIKGHPNSTPPSPKPRFVISGSGTSERL